MEADSHSVSSARPSSNTNPGANTPNPMAKKSGFRRLSWRRLFYAGGPLMQVRPRGLGKGGRGGADEGAHSETSLREPHHSSGFGGNRKGSIRFATASGGQSSSGCRDVRGPTVKCTERGDCYECPLCLNVQTVDHFPEMLTCPHRSCQDCLRQYLRIEIAESRINICCPECTEPLHPTDIRHILNDELFMAKYEEFMLRRVLATEPDARWCPAPDCSFAVIASGCASCPKIKCERPGCQTFFCYHCKQEWHPNQTCDAARAQRYPNVHSSSVSFSQDSAQHDIKPCPSCQVLIIKMDDGSCNHMTCAVCDAEFCWLCMKEISDLHYLSPSGCTFWGKKPWSRKKKILWQLGTLVGAPVGISLVAGIAVPAIIIGIPVWVGRKLHTRYETSSKHKRNLAITGGVTASILISPVLAGLAVGIGVPILLAYVYGVVPISLCRSGGCGVTTSASGVRIEFDENEMAGVAGGQATVDAQSVDTGSHQVANPSIGEMSLGMSASLSMGSGSHLERIGLVRDSDRESASNTAIAGASLTGSVSSSTVGGPAGHRLEVHADVASDKRFSFSSETTSATVSLSDRSATMSFVDDASMRALAGSIVGCRDTLPVEVHVDITSSALTDPSIETAVEAMTTECDATPAVPPVACPTTCGADETTSTRSWRGQRGKQKLSAAEKQANANAENGSVWSAEDTVSVSERVRFDENVSFIDDFLSSEEAQGALPPLSTDQWRPARRVGSASGCREESWKPSGQTETWERAQSWQGVCEEGGMVWDRRAREVPVLAAWNKLVSENGEAVEAVSVASSSMSSSSTSGSSASATTMENVTPLHRIATLEDCETDGNTNPNCNPNRASALCRSASGVAGCPVTLDSVTLTGFTADDTDDYGAGEGRGSDGGEVEDELTVVCHRCSMRSLSDS